MFTIENIIEINTPKMIRVCREKFKKITQHLYIMMHDEKKSDTSLVIALGRTKKLNYVCQGES